MARASRKGSIFDITTILRGVFTGGIGLLFLVYIHSELSAKMAPYFNNNAMSQAGRALTFLDYGIIFFLVGSAILAIWLAHRLPAHPVFVGAGFLVLAIIVWVSGTFTNLWLAIAHHPELKPITSNIPLTYTMLSNLPLTIGVIGFLIIAMMYMSGGDKGTRAPIA